MQLLHWYSSPPELNRPALIVALDGFIDAGSVASTASTFLRHRWVAEPVAHFDADALIDYRARRPSVVIDNGRLRRVEWPKLELLAAQVDGPHDALLLLGPEPDMKWKAFGDAIVDLCRALGVEMVIGLGAYPAATPHTRPVSVVRAENLAASGFSAGRPVAGYTGPIGANTAIQGMFAEHDLPAVGLWAEVPHYIAASPHPPGALKLVEMVAAIMGTDVDSTELEAAATHHLRQVDDAVAEHEEAAEMISGLEQLQDSGDGGGRLPSGEDLAAEIERFLRTQPDE
jgi:proteasome assembly chaperone (PAC2) family protein